MEHKLVNEEILIRDATGDDMTLVAEMIQELANFQNMPNGPKITANELRRDGFELERPLFHCKMAEVVNTGAVVGFAVYFPTYSTWEGKVMFLLNLYVKESHRRRGVGKTLLRTVVTAAVESGCARLDLHVLAWNPARLLYDQVGAENLTEGQGASAWSLPLSGDAFDALARKMPAV